MARTRYIIKTKGKFKLGKPFPYEDELNEKLARLTELNTLLNIDDKAIENVSIVSDRMAADQIPDGGIVADEKPSILGKIKEIREMQSDRIAKEKAPEKNIKEMDV